MTRLNFSPVMLAVGPFGTGTIPTLIILLPAGFIAGALTSNVNPQRLGAGKRRPGTGYRQQHPSTQRGGTMILLGNAEPPARVRSM